MITMGIVIEPHQDHDYGFTVRSNLDLKAVTPWILAIILAHIGWRKEESGTTHIGDQ